MNIANRLVESVNQFQRRHSLIGYVVAVLKLYGKLNCGKQAALLTYYAYLSLFPLLLIAVTVAQMFVSVYPHIQDQVVSAVTSYFPVLGDQLASHVQGLHRSGLALLIGLLFLLYGARGVAAALRDGVYSVLMPKVKPETAFFEVQATNIAMVIVGGVGLLLTASLVGFTVALSDGPGMFALSIMINMSGIFAVFLALYKLALKKVSYKELILAALLTAIGIVIMQLAGGYILTRVLKNLDALYSYFALSLGLLFWLYLQAQVVYYSLVAADIFRRRAWPVHLTD